MNLQNVIKNFHPFRKSKLFAVMKTKAFGNGVDFISRHYNRRNAVRPVILFGFVKIYSISQCGVIRGQKTSFDVSGPFVE